MSCLSFSDVQTLYKLYSPLKSESALQELLFKTNPSVYDYSINNNVRAFITTEIYKGYPNEASIKSAFVNRKLSKDTSAVSIFELPVGNSRIDLCRINGTSHAYEIKTDLDNLNRIQKQLSDYRSVFEYTHVICSYNKLPDILSSIDADIGIIYYLFKNNDYCFYTFRKALKSTTLNPEYQLSTFSHNEKKFLIKKYRIQEKNSPNESLLFLNPATINKEFKHVLKMRYERQWLFLKKHINTIPNIDYQYFYKTCIDPNIVYQ